MDIPKFVATCIDDEEVLFSESGDTPDIAYNEFMSFGQFEDHCRYYELGVGEQVDVFIYTAIDPKASDYDEEEIDPSWSFVLDKKVETRKATVI